MLPTPALAARRISTAPATCAGAPQVVAALAKRRSRAEPLAKAALRYANCGHQDHARAGNRDAERRRAQPLGGAASGSPRSRYTARAGRTRLRRRATPPARSSRSVRKPMNRHSRHSSACTKTRCSSAQTMKYGPGRHLQSSSRCHRVSTRCTGAPHSLQGGEARAMRSALVMASECRSRPGSLTVSAPLPCASPRISRRSTRSSSAPPPRCPAQSAFSAGAVLVSTRGADRLRRLGEAVSTRSIRREQPAGTGQSRTLPTVPYCSVEH
jgi:hypothetical protein